jgi:putative multiple sugar transport system permease protein
MFFQDLGRVLRKNIREFGMFIALFAIWVIFTLTTNGLFLSPRNLSNLFNQSGYIAVLAVGMTLVIVIRHIDLSVGFLGGFLGAVAAIMLQSWGLPIYLVIPLVLGLGIIAGMITATPVALLGIPSFVASLAGWLVYRGLIGVVTSGSGTIIISDKIYNAIGNGFIPDLFSSLNFLPHIHKLTVILGIVGVVLYISSALSSRRKKQAYHFEVMPMSIFILQLILMAAIILGITWVLAGYNGLSWTLIVVLIVVGIYQFITTQTVLGRHIYATGGNPEAAELSGISVKRVTFIVFASMGMLAALAGILYSSRLQSATTTAGQLWELDAIAAAYVGGVSAAGGVGSVVGSLIGALVMISLTNGMNLMGIDANVQYIVRGFVLAAAVIFDVTTRRSAK